VQPQSSEGSFVRLHVFGLTAVAALAALAPAASAAHSARDAFAPVGSTGTPLQVTAPRTAVAGHQFVIHVRLERPAPIAAFQASVLADTDALDIGTGVPGNGLGTMIEPAHSRSAARVGYFGGSAPGTGRDLLDVLVTPRKRGTYVIRLALPLGVSHAGSPEPLRFATDELRVKVGSSPAIFRPKVTAPVTSLHPRGGVHLDLSHDGVVSSGDLWQAVVAWNSSIASRLAQGSDGSGGDVDADGYTTVRDLQLLSDHVTTAGKPATPGGRLAAVTPSTTYTVNTTSDAPDAHPGDGVCATSAGTCSLRAAIDEANRRAGDEEIDFNIPGNAPQTITISSGPLTPINSATGSISINGYSEPGAHANTDPHYSNALPGIVLNGPDGAAGQTPTLQIFSSGNVVRGLAFDNVGRGIVMTGTGSANNLIAGNFFGMDANGTLQHTNDGYAAIDIATGANHNQIGTPALTDRNVIAGFFYGIDHVGVGVTNNVTQNNIIGMSPNGQTVLGAGCDDVDHNTGAQNNLLGGPDAGDGNVLVAGICDTVEYSHGWNQALPPRQDTSQQYQVNNNTVQGNYLGFAPDGSFKAAYIPGQRSDEEDGSGVNILDVANGNKVIGNYINARANGVQIFGFQTTGNIVQGNHIGIGPLGQAGYIGYSGVSVRWHATNEAIVGNAIGNTGQRADQQPPVDPANPNSAGCIQNVNNLPEGCGAGVRVDESDDTGVRISQNTFTNIGNGIGIDLAPLGVINPNDVGDKDNGANLKLNFPVITAANTNAVVGTACAGCTVEISKTLDAVGKNGNAVQYVNSAVADAQGNFLVPVTTLVAGDIVTSIAIDGAGNTSEQGVNAGVAQGPPPPPPPAAGGGGTTTPPAGGGTTTAPPAKGGGGTQPTGKSAGTPAGVVPTGEIVLWSKSSSPIKITIDGGRGATVAPFKALLVANLTTGSHTVAIRIGKGKKTTARLTVLPGRATLGMASGTKAKLKLKASKIDLPSVTSSKSGLVVINAAGRALSLKVDGKGKARKLRSGSWVRSGLALGSHKLSASASGTTVTAKLSLSSRGFALVIVGSKSGSLKTSVKVVPVS
jgi:CSLREA domain-containing protein